MKNAQTSSWINSWRRRKGREGVQNVAEIRSRMHAIGQTRQITRAMNMIAGSQMRKALALSDANQAYFDSVRRTICDILRHSPNVQHPFLQHTRSTNHNTYIVVAGDKGFAGSYNNDVCTLALQHMNARVSQEDHIFSIGYMTRDFFRKRGYEADVEFLHIAQNPSLFNARRVTHTILDLFRQGLMDRVYVAFTRMVSHSVQKPVVLQLLPLRISSFEDVQDVDQSYQGELAYEPSPQAVLETLVEQYLIGAVYTVLVQSYASEQSARMRATQSAMKNADEMLTKLGIEYNRVRQDGITNEIIETAAGASALLEGGG